MQKAALFGCFEESVNDDGDYNQQIPESLSLRDGNTSSYQLTDAGQSSTAEPQGEGHGAPYAETQVLLAVTNGDERFSDVASDRNR
ncbi:hypothetical protein FGB62_61g03 [Gracilaria domingensis]|nr:hypothetical protein FGB62_61g03 [Gracilaria domingensis]